MPDVYLSADVAHIRAVIHLLQPWVLVKELPSLILCLVCHLRLPRIALLSPMLWVWFERRYLVVVTSAHRHLNATLFNVLFTAISLSLHIWRIHSRASSRRTAIISLMEAEEGTKFFASLPSTTLWIIDLMYSLSIISSKS